jgi:Zn-dependent protease
MCGDNTADAAGRRTLNPMVHIDPFGTILLPLLLYWVSGGKFLFGYAKPVPVSWSRLRDPRLQGALVSLAGPMSNFIMAFAWLLLAVVLQLANVPGAFFHLMAAAGVTVNLVLFALNLLPLPPLDGGQAALGLLPPRIALPFSRITPYGFIILLVLIYTGLLNFWLWPLVDGAQSVLGLMARPLTFLLS